MNQQQSENKKKYKNKNFGKVMKYLSKNFPRKSVEDFCKDFGYMEHIKGVLTLEEEEFKVKFPEVYKKIQKSYTNKRSDFRSSFETARDICSNFIMEDLLKESINKTFPFIKISLNKDEKRDIEYRPSNLPDFIFENEDTNKKIMFDLKIDWNGKSITKKIFFFRGDEKDDYKNYGALALIWCPENNKFTFVDFRKEVDGDEGIDNSKGGKKGFWAKLDKNIFDEIYFGERTFLNKMIEQLDKFSRK